MSETPNPNEDADIDELFRQLLSSLDPTDEIVPTDERVPVAEIVLRNSLWTGCISCLIGIAFLGVGILLMTRFPVQFPGTLFAIIMAILGAVFLHKGLSYVLDRSPRLSFRSDGLLVHRTSSRQRQLLIPWSSMISARYCSTTINFGETSATIELTLATPINGWDSIVVPVQGIDMESRDIYEIIRRRANLR